MRISLVGPGMQPVPPPSRGGVENTLWGYQQSLLQLGCEVQLVNLKKPLPEIAKVINAFRPDFVNIHWEIFYPLHEHLTCRQIAFTTHHCRAGFANDDLTARIPKPWGKFPFFIFTLAAVTRFNYIQWGFPPDRVYTTPTGTDSNRFRFSPVPEYPDRSICLGVICERKNQAYVQGLNANVDFVGAVISPKGFDCSHKNYLGAWPREHLDNHLTDYANMVLLSQHEGAPAVCIEALMAGLGLVLSERSAANLDVALPFIDLVPHSRMRDPAYVASLIARNREKSVKMRKEIREYAVQNFDWPRLTERYLTLVSDKIISNVPLAAKPVKAPRAKAPRVTAPRFKPPPVKAAPVEVHAPADSKTTSLLEHLILCPTKGIGNRLQSIASAKRLQSMYGFRLTLCWDWGDYHGLFNPEPALDWLGAVSPEMKATYRHMEHGTLLDGERARGQRVPIGKDRHIILVSPCTFRADEENGDKTWDLKPYLPRPVDNIFKTVVAFKQAHFTKTVGMHIRRSDLKVANQWSPDQLFVSEAERLINDGYNIFLATDNSSIEQMMKNKFGNHIIIYPKNPELKIRWPREAFSYEETADDLVDLFLLAASEFIVGPFGSSFTRIAFLYNGSKKCRILKTSDSVSPIQKA